MTIGAVLLIYAVALGRRVPCRGDWLERAPRLGAAVLLAAAWSVLAALVLAGVTLAVPATALSGGLSSVLGACVLRLRAAYATPGGALVAAVGLALSAGIVLRVAWSAYRALRERRDERRRQRLLTSFAARPLDGGGAVLVDHPQPAAYCLAGRHPLVVVTSGAAGLLDAAELAAVLAHEHAHLSARHHRRLAAAAVAGRALPEFPLLCGLGERVHHLLELHADQIASGRHDPETLARALVSVASARTATPATALAAAGGETAERIRRLLVPPPPLGPARRALTRGLAALLIATPLVLALTPAAIAATQPPVHRTGGPAAVLPVGQDQQ